MTTVPQTTVAVLFYALPPAINFARLVADLDAALAAIPHDERHLAWDCDDVAMVDIDGGRLVFAWAEKLPGTLPACLALAIGPGPDPARPDTLTPRAEELARSIVGRIATRLPAASTVWTTVDGVMTAERLDTLIDTLIAAPAAVDLPADAAEDAGAAVALAAGPGADRTAGIGAGKAALRRRVDAPDAAALDRLMARMERELNGEPPIDFTPPPAAASPRPETPVRKPRRDAAGSRPAKPRDTGALARAKARGQAAAAAAAAIANDIPDLPRPATAELARIRAALYPPEPETQDQPSPVVRVAVGTIGATLLITAAPVGAALLTYNTLRGANLLVTARAVALTGAAIGLMQAPLVQAFLSFG